MVDSKKRCHRVKIFGLNISLLQLSRQDRMKADSLERKSILQNGESRCMGKP